MSLKALSNDRAAAAWRSHGRDKDDVFNLFEWLFLVLAVVPTLVVHPLSQQLKRWLGSVLLLFGHV